MRQISALAHGQLEAWENLAKNHLLVPEIREEDGRLHLICPQCQQSVYAVEKQSITSAILQASVVAHLRNMHREMDPDA